MANKHLYSNFLSDKRIYNLNRGYWKRMLSKVGENISMPFYQEKFSNGVHFYDGNPIASAYLPNLNKSIRIIQEEPETDSLEIGVWTEDKEFEDKNIKELVISLELSRESSKVVRELIKGWLQENWDDEKLEKTIEEYSN
jgi:hypothetical protein